ncbi:hypothetical protein BU25DRAFT_411028 [Macroventuria anomochaeta]|uniref:Uncharacterized protein n=1 Tax=Macroventuria anomochaeta TaxID=301207 RepID=A0ACB6S2R6_9PLEO|nr:uncharacterized protein BU25DRAFT_411028 [Macroventuria anomochaeta]KAF2627427.1 hypothetical protein BU25DRAFT_411028 [Macroventuria anomochaeta]
MSKRSAISQRGALLLYANDVKTKDRYTGRRLSYLSICLRLTTISLPMTHAPPNDRELAKLNKWIDRHVNFDYLQHRHRIGDLLHTQMIARSVVEFLFLCRKGERLTCREGSLTTSPGVLSIYAQTKALHGLAEPGLSLNTDSLNITRGTIDKRIFVGITTNNGRQVVLRGGCAETCAEATVLFIEALLDTSTRYQTELLKQVEENGELGGKDRHAEGGGSSIFEA